MEAIKCKKNINKDGDVLKNWTKDEKFELLQALKEHGSRDVDQLSLIVCSKSKDEIKAALEFYRIKALGQPIPVTHKRKLKEKNTSYVPLSSWAKLISDQQNFDVLQTETATALRFIAEFEDRPTPPCTEKIDFKKIYNTIADALEGKALPDNKHTKSIIDVCVVETALTSKTFLRTAAFKRVLKSINMTEKPDTNFSKPIKNLELANLRHLSTQKSYNPLCMADNHLKSSIP